MKKTFFLITFFLSLHSTFFSKERKVRKAIKYLVEEKFQECLNLNLELLDEYPNIPLGYFVMFKYYFSKKNPEQIKQNPKRKWPIFNSSLRKLAILSGSTDANPNILCLNIYSK